MSSPTLRLPLVYTVSRYDRRKGEIKVLGRYIAVNASLEDRR